MKASLNTSWSSGRFEPVYTRCRLFWETAATSVNVWQMSKKGNVKQRVVNFFGLDMNTPLAKRDSMLCTTPKLTCCHRPWGVWSAWMLFSDGSKSGLSSTTEVYGTYEALVSSQISTSCKARELCTHRQAWHMWAQGSHCRHLTDTDVYKDVYHDMWK